ncbi:MAG TPA: alanine--tRNA ligase [Thermoanaerobaculia bacterium]|nr:alanine--tRNA ligase [Thermoanaerobaculia bacterium]
MRSQDIRKSFLDFFVERDHLAVPSSPLVPHGDPTLLFTNSGMVQFKNVFLGLESLERPRAVTAQKCLRVSGKHNDLENVGPSPRHHTFFEMLGNFSFGDYFKEQAIALAWELVTRVWGLPPQHLFASVFEEDEEAFDLWRRISSLPTERVARCGAADNFWAMGDTGPCGPCSEIFVDRSPGLPEVPFAEGAESGRYLEIWNLVFMQFDRSAEGVLTPLPKPSIDTGSGLERVAAALQGVESNYDTDLFQPLIQATAQTSSVAYGAGEETDVAMRVIADHLRAVAFLLADGVIPSNEGRGYVLRRILRRAVRHGMRLGFEGPFLAGLLPTLESIMGDAYPELGSTRDASAATIDAEERKFLATVAGGARQVQDAIEAARAAGRAALEGPTVFRLYDTYGLPLELIREIAEEERFVLDEAGFEQELSVQRARSRSATSGRQRQVTGLRAALLGRGTGDLQAGSASVSGTGTASGAGSGELVPTSFEGYDTLELDGARIVRLARISGDTAETVDRISPGQGGVVALDRTVFYAEAGGQVADRGTMTGPRGRARVDDVQKDASGVIFHWVTMVSGELAVGDELRLEVDAALREPTERHHTATHLLHAALRRHLGPGVRQAGSLVHPERLRFDFTHPQGLDEDVRGALEDTVGEWVRRAAPVRIEQRPHAEAVAAGAMALFGEKYGDVVRTVDVPGISLELCGGCHVENTGEIGSFVIVQERGIASGVRRIEALAGAAADRYRREQQRRLQALEEALGVGGDRAPEEVAALKERLRETERELSQARMKLLAGGNGRAEEGEAEVAGIRMLLKEVPPAPAGELRSLADVLRGRLGSGVVVLGTRESDKVSLIAAVTEDLKGRIHAGQIARSMGDAVGGSGGGRPDFAQAGGKSPEKLGAAFDAAREAVSRLAEAS